MTQPGVDTVGLEAVVPAQVCHARKPRLVAQALDSYGGDGIDAVTATEGIGDDDIAGAVDVNGRSRPVIDLDGGAAAGNSEQRGDDKGEVGAGGHEKSTVKTPKGFTVDPCDASRRRAPPGSAQEVTASAPASRGHVCGSR